MEIPKSELVKIDDVRHDDMNPNVMEPKRFEALKKSIVKYGFIMPVITNKDGVIIQRWEELTGKRAEKL